MNNADHGRIDNAANSDFVLMDGDGPQSGRQNLTVATEVVQEGGEIQSERFDAEVKRGDPEGAAGTGRINQDGSLLTVVFRLPNGSEKTVSFANRPLGLDFNKKVPIMVRKVAGGSVGDLQGVKVGWFIVKVNGIGVSAVDFETAFHELSTGARTLRKQSLQ